MKEVKNVTEPSEKLNTSEKVANWLHKTKGYTKAAITEYFEAYGADCWWKQRERERIELEQHKIPAWVHKYQRPKLADFFVCAAKEDQMKISFVPDEAYGRADRRVMTTVGRFLTAHFSDVWNEKQIRDIGDEHRQEFGPPVVHFAFDASSIIDCYRNGPVSCMNKRELESGHEHPVGIYDGPDTGLAVLAQGNKITARTVIRIDTTPMQFTKIYGDISLLKRRLDQLGFREAAGLKNARLRLERLRSGQALLPYLDNCSGVAVSKDGKFFVVDATGEKIPNTASGVITLPALPDYACDHCHTQGYQHNMYRVFTLVKRDAFFCPACSSTQTFIGKEPTGCGRLLRTEAIVINDEYVLNSPAHLPALGYTLCAHDNTWRDTEDVIFVPSRGSHYMKRSVCVPMGGTEPHMRSECIIDANKRWALK
jgi:hypothetical protein